MPEGLFKKPMIVEGLENTQCLWRTFDLERNGKALDYAVTYYSLFEPDIELLGVGAEHIVTTKPGDHDKAVSYEHSTDKDEEREHPLHRHEQYQMQKLFHNLFPNYFPDIYAATSNHDPHFVKQRVRKKPNTIACYESFNNVINESKELGLSLELDPNPANFLRTDDGNVYYVDNIAIDNSADNFYNHLNEEALQAFYERHKISEKSREKIKKCIQRLREYRLIKRIFEPSNSEDTVAVKLQKATVEEGVDLTKTEDQKMMARVQQFINALDKNLSQPDEQEK